MCFGPVSLFYLFSFYLSSCIMLSASRLAFNIVDLVACTVAALKDVHGNTNPNQRISTVAGSIAPCGSSHLLLDLNARMLTAGIAIYGSCGRQRWHERQVAFISSLLLRLFPGSSFITFLLSSI